MLRAALGRGCGERAILAVLLVCQWTGWHYEGFCLAAMQPVFGNLSAGAEKHGGVSFHIKLWKTPTSVMACGLSAICLFWGADVFFPPRMIESQHAKVAGPVFGTGRLSIVTRRKFSRTERRWIDGVMVVEHAILVHRFENRFRIVGAGG